MKKTSHADLLYRLNRELKFKPVVREQFHTLRIEGNKASHQFITSHKEALDGFKPDGLKVARTLAIWFYQSSAKQGSAFKPGGFIVPPDSAQAEIVRRVEKLFAGTDIIEQQITQALQ